MTMTTKQVLDLVNAVGQAGMAGRSEAARRFTNPAGGLYASDRMTPAQTEFLKAVSRVKAPQRATYTHPATVAPEAPAKVDANGKRLPPVGLAPAQMSWIQRLPADPSQVPFDDAVELVRLTRTITAASDKRFVQSAAQPVVDYHDAKAAEVDLANAKVPLPRVPHEALAALADAISSEVPELGPDEAVQRASLALRDSTDRRRAERDQQAEVAQRAIDAHEAAVADRLAVHR